MNKDYDIGEELQKESEGVCLLIYSPTNDGKTHAIGTAPDPILIINSEKSPVPVLKWAIKAGKKIKVIQRNTFDEVMEAIAKIEDLAIKDKLQYKTIALDSLSFIQAQFKLEAEDAHGQRKSADPSVLDIITRYSFGDDAFPAWGVLNSMLKRLSSRLIALSQYGKIVIVTATEQANPKYKSQEGVYFEAGPSIMGKEYPSIMQGYFHLIGRIIEPWKLQEDGTIKPPVVSFVSEDKSYVARCMGGLVKKGARLPLNFEHILKILKEE